MGIVHWMHLVGWAYEIAARKRACALPRRWQHVQGVAERARELSRLAGDQADLLQAAAVLHDVGYAPDLVASGFHPVDGAKYLLTVDAPRHLVDLIAHHSCAAVEARLRGLSGPMRGFRDQQGTVRDALWYCDLTTSPDGEPVEVEHRLEEIRPRYGPEHVVARFLDAAMAGLLAAVRRTEERLSSAPA